MTADWHIPPQTREAANQRFAARLASIFAQKQADAANAAYDKLRAINIERAIERREQREDAMRVAIALRKLAEDARRIEAEWVAVAKIRSAA